MNPKIVNLLQNIENITSEIAEELQKEDQCRQLEPKPTRYMKPKTDRDKTFPYGVKCEVDDHAVKGCHNWKQAILIACNSGMCIVAHPGSWGSVYVDEIRIPEFTPENPPPVDTLVYVDNFLLHFAYFKDDGRVVVYDGRRSSKIEGVTVVMDGDYTFVDFPESDYIWMEE